MSELGLGENFSGAVLTQPKTLVWSSGRVSDNAKAEGHRLVPLGHEFLEQRDPERIHRAMIWTTCMFRVAFALAFGSIKAPGGPGITRVKRAMVREAEEIAMVIDGLWPEMGLQECDRVVGADSRLILMHAVIGRGRPWILTDEERECLVDPVRPAAPGAGAMSVTGFTEARAFGVSIRPPLTIFFSHQNEWTERCHPQHIA